MLLEAEPEGTSVLTLQSFMDPEDSLSFSQEFTTVLSKPNVTFRDAVLVSYGDAIRRFITMAIYTCVLFLKGHEYCPFNYIACKIPHS
jgi:hypothetical protein